MKHNNYNNKHNIIIKNIKKYDNKHNNYLIDNALSTIIAINILLLLLLLLLLYNINK